MPPGRPRLDVWELFDENGVDCSCKRCRVHITKPSVAKLERHISKCGEYPLEDKLKRKRAIDDREAKLEYPQLYPLRSEKQARIVSGAQACFPRVGVKCTPIIVYDTLNLRKTGTGDENSDEEEGPGICYPADSDSSDDDEQHDRMSSSSSDEDEGRVPAQEGDEGLEDQADIYTSLYFLDMNFDYSGDPL